MFKRSLVFTAMIVCLLSIFIINNISYAGRGLTTWGNAVTAVNNAKEIMKTERDQYHYIQGDLNTLIGLWKDETAHINNQRLLSVLAATGAIISVASGGSLYPAAYVIAVAALKLTYTETTSSVSDYLTSMGALLLLMDTARSNVDTAYNGGYLTVKPHGGYPGIGNTRKHTPGYTPEYDAYLNMAVNHLNSYEYYQGNNYNNVVTLTIGVLTSSVKMGGLKGWHHKGKHDGDENSGEDHVFEKFMTFADFVVNPDLPLRYPCKGGGNELFRTPYEAKFEHRAACANSKYEDRDMLDFGNVERGCGTVWYTCGDQNKVKEKEELHKLRTCQKTFTAKDGTEGACLDSNGNPLQYRNCLNFGRDHNESDWLSVRTDHSDEGDDLEAGTPTPSPTPTPTPTPTPSPSPTPAPTPTYHACGVHQTWQSGDHSFQASCLLTNDNGDTCEVTGFYACSHTCVFPIACGARSWTNCMANVSASTQHQTTCPAGHSYWSCSLDGVAAHATPITCKRLGCSVTIMKCQNTGNGGCFSGGTEYRYHKLQ